MGRDNEVERMVRLDPGRDGALAGAKVEEIVERHVARDDLREAISARAKGV